MVDAEKTIEIGGNADLKNEIDTLVPQSDEGEFEISFSEDGGDNQPEPKAEPQQRRAQNDPVDGYDPSQHYQSQMAERERDFSEREERYARALADAEKRRVATERESAQVAIDGIDLRIRTTLEAIKAAKAERDYSAEVDFAEQLQNLRRVREQIETATGNLPSNDQIDGQFANWQRQQRASRPATGSADITPRSGNQLADRYMQNNAWMRDPSQSQAREYLLTVDRQLAAEGFDAKSPAHFEELSRRVAARFPQVGVKMLDGRAVGGAVAPLAGSRPQNPPVAAARSSGAAGTGSQQNRNRRQVTLNDTDRRTMRALGLDPTNKAVQQRYAREKLAREQMDRR
jgi:hypothetical protein